MDVVVAGGHGKVALHALRLLAERGDRARGLIRNPDHTGDIESVGAEAVLCDLEEIEAAEIPPLIEAAQFSRVRRYLIVSAMGVNHPDRWSEQMRPYYQAKAEADAQVEASGLDYTIVRPGGLTDEEGSGRIQAAPMLERGGQIPRE